MKRYLIVSALFCSVSLNAQKDYSVEYANTITAAELKDHVTYLAGPECEGRETGEHGQKVAAKFLADYFASLGIKPVTDNYFQVFPLETDGSDCLSWVSFGGNTLEESKDYISYCGFQKNEFKPGSEYVMPFAGYGIESDGWSDYSKIGDVKGKWVVILDSEPVKNGVSLISKKKELSNWSTSVEQKVATAEQKGAAGVIIVTADLQKKRDEENYFALESRFNGRHIPYFYLSEEAAARYFFKTPVKDIREEVNRGKHVNIVLKADRPEIMLGWRPEPKTGENVLAFIEGSDLKDEIVVITAHYDHLGKHDGQIYYGADDDGSGTATIMEIAEAFMEAKKNGHGPRRSVLIMPVSGEEKGLLGSDYYSENPVFPLKNTVADLNIDMIGRVDEKHKDGNYVYLIGSDKLSSELHSISENMNKKYSNLSLDYTYNDPDDPNQFYYRSDHYNFAKHNIPVIFYFTGVHKDYHKPTDTADKLDYNKTEKIARLVFHTAWELANRNEKIKVDRKSDFENWR